MREQENNYALKVDDLLLRLLSNYHNIDASEAASFFGKRATEMLECEPNITERNRRPVTHYITTSGSNRTETFAHRYSKSKTHFKTTLRPMDVDGKKVYVLRGFYPETNLPFKMTLVQPSNGGIARSKVTIGLKEHHTMFKESEVDIYNSAVSEAILLGVDVKEDSKIEYEYRKFKAMRPKGMELYHEQGKRRSN